MALGKGGCEEADVDWSAEWRGVVAARFVRFRPVLGRPGDD
jgi:hypothetical protein